MRVMSATLFYYVASNAVLSDVNPELSKKLGGEKRFVWDKRHGKYVQRQNDSSGKWRTDAPSISESIPLHATVGVLLSQRQHVCADSACILWFQMSFADPKKPKRVKTESGAVVMTGKRKGGKSEYGKHRPPPSPPQRC